MHLRSKASLKRVLVRMRAAPPSGLVPVILLTATLAACYPGSDAVYAQRQAAERQAVVTQNLRAATAQTPRGTPVEGVALRALVAERTWISEYERFPDGSPGPHRTYDYFREDGQFIWAHTWVYGEAKAMAGDYWRVEGSRLCWRNQRMWQEAKCYTVALDAKAGIQLYIDAPGTPNHGLLTRVIKRSEAGPPKTTGR